MSDEWVEKFAEEYARLSGLDMEGAREIGREYLRLLQADGFDLDDGSDPAASALREWKWRDAPGSWSCQATD